jgi:hypothetical protein
MNQELRNLCEQIQEGIITFAESSSSVGITCTELDSLCEIVVSNFQKFDSSELFQPVTEKATFAITNIEFDVSGSEYGYWAPGEWSEEELQAGLQNEWLGRIVGPILEDDLVDHITDVSGWCVRNVRYERVRYELY